MKLVILLVELLPVIHKLVQTLVVMEPSMLTNNVILEVESALNQTMATSQINAERDVSHLTVVMVSLIAMKPVILELQMD